MLKVLELGSGTGLVGLAAAAIWKCVAYLTDLPDIVENLDRNIERNCMIIEDHGGSAEADVMDWSKPPAVRLGTFPVGREYLPSAQLLRWIIDYHYRRSSLLP
jgi:hypothetical protein